MPGYARTTFENSVLSNFFKIYNWSFFNLWSFLNIFSMYECIYFSIFLQTYQDVRFFHFSISVTGQKKTLYEHFSLICIQKSQYYELTPVIFLNIRLKYGHVMYFWYRWLFIIIILVLQKCDPLNNVTKKSENHWWIW